MMNRIQKVVWSVAATGLVLALQAPAAGQQDKAATVMAETRKALGGKKLEGMKSFSVQAKVQRNLGNFQIGSDVEFLLDLPDKYLRSESMTGGPMAVSAASGFNGESLIGRVNAPNLPGGAGGMTIRMMGAGGPVVGGGLELTPEQQAEMQARQLRSARQDVSRLMLGWFGMAHPTMTVEYSYAGEAESPDGRAHVIDVKGPDGFAARLFIDQESHLPLMLTYEGPRMLTIGGMRGGMAMGGGPGGVQVQRGAAGQQGREMSDEEREKVREEIEKLRAQTPEMVEYSLFFDDWRTADGIRFPHAIQRAVGGTTDEEWTLSRPRVNPKIDAKKFQAAEVKQ
jgi:hypothetical protein